MSQAAPKRGLGRGLGDLMGGEGAAGTSQNRDVPSEHGAETIKVEFGRGMETLVSRPGVHEAEIARPERQLLPPWFFFAADLLLLAFTAGICLNSDEAFDAGTLIFCAVSVSAGALMGIAGVFRAARSGPS
jgi:hypothetical protein